MIAILDYGIGNISSIANMLKKIDVKAVVTSDIEIVKDASKLILPGVGHFDYCMQQLRKAPFYSILNKKVLEEKVPVLGVCAGCQMLMENSEEGNEPGLGWIPGKVVKFDFERLPPNYKIPHMGWTDIKPENDCALYDAIEDPRFYFVHSYQLNCGEGYVTATAEYGYQFPASVSINNIIGVQFHPEKSHKFGMKLYGNFVNHY